MEKQILLPDAIRREMNATFRCSRNELHRALTYERKSSRAKMLRVAALERGGLLYTGQHAPNGFRPEVETTHDHATHTMTQRLGGRVALVVSFDAKTAKIVIDGEPIATFDNMTLRSWGDVLYGLQQICNQINE